MATALSRLFARETDSPRSSPPTLDGSALTAIVRIVELQLRQVPLDTLTAESLPVMLGLFDAPAGALLTYRREDATLTLAAARGLAVAGAEALDVVRWGDEPGFEMPLRALVDRKIYVIDRPGDDTFARRLTALDDRRQLSAVAAVPLYRWQLPVGVLLVFAGEAPITPDALLAPLLAYDVLALALSTMLWAREERGATPLPASDVAPPPLICVPWIDTRRDNGTERARFEAERDAAVAAARAEGQAALDAGIAAARDESRTALDTMLQELRTAVAGLEAERQATAQERVVLQERLAGVEQERSLLGERLDAIEAAMSANRPAAPEPTPAPKPPPPKAAGSTPPPSAPPAARAPAATERAAAPEATAAAPVERRVLESNATLRDHIQTALSTAIPAGRGSLAVVNLFGCDAARLGEMSAAADAGITVIGYAADGSGSRILGPLRCFAAPPTAAEAATAIANPRGNRRTILLSDDIDAFMAAKGALAKAGHSVSMACDEKQALDLLAILRPDTVVVDVRAAGAPAVEFLDALGPESGRILTLLVHGDPTGGVLASLAKRMLRPTALDVDELVKVCRNALPEAAKRTGAR